MICGTVKLLTDKIGNQTAIIIINDSYLKETRFVVNYTVKGTGIDLDYQFDTDNKIITNITTENNTVETILNSNNFYNQKNNIRIFDYNGQELNENDRIGTNSKIEIYENDQVIDEYKIAIKGDIDCDGKIDIYDILKLIEIVFDDNDKSNLDSCIKIAGNCLDDSEDIMPDLYDILRLIEYNFDNKKW